MKTILLAMKKSPRYDEARELLSKHYLVQVAGTAKAISATQNHRHAQLILISDDLPGANGPGLIKNLRKTYDAPIIVLLESENETDIVTALDAGANDVLILPLGGAVHLARIRAALRGNITPKHSGVYSVGGLKVDYTSRTVNVNDKPVHLTPIEFRILALLTKNPGRLMPYDQIISEIWGPDNSDNLVLRVNMANIRKKIEPNPTSPIYILTESGVGYRASSSSISSTPITVSTGSGSKGLSPSDTYTSSL